MDADRLPHPRVIRMQIPTMDLRDQFGSDAPILPRREAPPVTPQSIREAVDACNADRDKANAVGLQLAHEPYPVSAFDRDSQVAMLLDREHLARMADRWGFMRVFQWLRNIAQDNGEVL